MFYLSRARQRKGELSAENPYACDLLWLSIAVRSAVSAPLTGKVSNPALGSRSLDPPVTGQQFRQPWSTERKRQTDMSSKRFCKYIATPPRSSTYRPSTGSLAAYPLRTYTQRSRARCPRKRPSKRPSRLSGCKILVVNWDHSSWGTSERRNLKGAHD